MATYCQEVRWLEDNFNGLELNHIPRRLNIQGDSQLIVNQVMKESSCHDARMATYCQEVRRLEDKFDGLELNHIPRHLNECLRQRSA